MKIIPQISIFDYSEIEILGDLGYYSQPNSLKHHKID